MQDWWNGRYYKQSYSEEDDTYSLTGDRVEKVQDYNDFVKQAQSDRKFEAMVQDMTIGRLNGKSNFYKYRTKF